MDEDEHRSVRQRGACYQLLVRFIGEPRWQKVAAGPAHVAGGEFVECKRCEDREGLLLDRWSEAVKKSLGVMGS